MHVGRQRCFDADGLAGHWMRKAQPAGVQGLPGYAFARAAVEIIAEERMAEVGHVDTDLVRASGFKRQMHEGKLVIGAEGFVMRAGCLPVGRNLAQDDAWQGAGNRGVDCAGWRRELAGNQGEVFAVERLDAFGGELVLDLRLLGNQHEAARLAVKPVHRMIGVSLALLRIMEQDGVGQRAVCFLCRRVDELARRLVDDEQPFIFVADVKRQVFGCDIAGAQDIVGHDVAGLELCARRVDELAVDAEGA